VKTPVIDFKDEKPYAYQVIEKEQVEIPVMYRLAELDDRSDYSYGFNVSTFDTTKPLIIDPAQFIYCGYIGGSESDSVFGIAVDGEGNAYLSGDTSSDHSSFPEFIGPDLTYNGSGEPDVFVAKLNADGTSLIYCGYIGGVGWDIAYSIVVDEQGCLCSWLYRFTGNKLSCHSRSRSYLKWRAGHIRS